MEKAKTFSYIKCHFGNFVCIQNLLQLNICLKDILWKKSFFIGLLSINHHSYFVHSVNSRLSVIHISSIYLIWFFFCVIYACNIYIQMCDIWCNLFCTFCVMWYDFANFECKNVHHFKINVYTTRKRSFSSSSFVTYRLLYLSV